MSSFKMSLWCQTLLVLFTVVYSTADEDYENKLTKLWSLSGTSNVDGSAVLNVTSASIVIQPSSYNDEAARTTRYSRQPQKYAFKPRAIPLRRADQPSQVERTVYYTPDEYKSEVLFPGNYLPIAKEKSNENLTKDSVYTPRSGGFHPKAIPLIRSEEYQKRSLDEDSEPIIKKPEGFSEQTASRRSISYLFGDLDDSEDGEDDGEDDIDTEDGSQGKHRKKPKIKADIFGEIEEAVDGNDDDDDEDEVEEEEDVDREDIDPEVETQSKHRKKPKIKISKLKKYARPLLLAYKIKFLALAPVIMAGLLLLVTMKGIAGFFFALFAAVMGLHKGGF